MSINSVKSKKIALIISYCFIIVNTMSNLILTPMYLKFLGIEMYGLYQMVYSVAHYILILDFGISTTMIRYISLYHAKDDYISERNFSAHCLYIVLSVIALVSIIGAILNNFITSIYPSITDSESSTAHYIFIIMVITIGVTIFEHYFQGIILAYEHFTIVKAASVLKVIIKLGLTILMLVLNFDVVAIVLADLITSLLSIAFLIVYSFKIIGFKIKLTKFDLVLIGSILSFMLAIFLQSVVAYVNNVVDKTILGIMTTKRDVAIYSVALTFITFFNSLPSAISGLFLPQATKLVAHNADRKTLTEYVIRPGRYQFMICGAIISGFILFGEEFIALWSGEDTVLAWKVAIIIMIPNTIPLIESAAVNVLDAKKKRLFRSLVLFFMSLLNVIVSVILVNKFGMTGAPIGTAIAFVVGNGIIMNIYYYRIIGIDVLKMFKEIFSRTWLCIIFSALCSFPLNFLFCEYSWFTLIIKLLLFSSILFFSILLFGLNNSEKKDFKTLFAKVIKR